MNLDHLLTRASAKVRRALADRLHRRTVQFALPAPIVSFTFDDAPKSAFLTGGKILREHGGTGTFYVSLGLLDSTTEVGPIGSIDDLVAAVEHGNELGCHTFDHVDAWETSRLVYLESVERNREALGKLLPDARFTTFAYPKNGATYDVKEPLERLFICSRGGGQSANIDVADLNLVKACFLDRRQNVDLAMARALIDHNAHARGWLVFATHDIVDNPSPFGCTTRFLSSVVEHAARSGALLLPVAEACHRVVASERGHSGGATS
jgi:peptidoglycan/xylan/chitin deacetylase (PgdA/CDA1 family)